MGGIKVECLPDSLLHSLLVGWWCSNVERWVQTSAGTLLFILTFNGCKPFLISHMTSLEHNLGKTWTLGCFLISECQMCQCALATASHDALAPRLAHAGRQKAKEICTGRIPLWICALASWPVWWNALNMTYLNYLVRDYVVKMPKSWNKFINKRNIFTNVFVKVSRSTSHKDWNSVPLTKSLAADESWGSH